MDYQEAINRHIEECKHRIDVITEFMEANRDADKDKCLENIEIFKTAISAMKELQLYKDSKLCLIPENVYGKQCDELDEYKQLGTLEEVREAVEKQNECKNCGYKIHSNRISELNSCNDCGLANICEKRPELGQYCRINCYDWSGKNE